MNVYIKQIYDFKYIIKLKFSNIWGPTKVNINGPKGTAGFLWYFYSDRIIIFGGRNTDWSIGLGTKGLWLSLVTNLLFIL